ncbi:RraA family protein [Vibrio penaeicida]|uniref:RraA family protein n=1 Tax=Vibrio penaeicida TaxID=104609 RepID=UPI00273467E7|nr:RraA family protein [Vibrio penaeicida]MDP2571725.1 RraA family protein [Vibrio penaeicida]
MWQDDNSLFSIIRDKLFTAVVGDVMDKMDLQNQFLPPYLTVLDDKQVIVGRAMTVVEADMIGETSITSHNTALNQPFGLMFQALDSLEENEVYICTGSSPLYALWGGLMSTRAMKLNAAGAVLDGYVRDSKEIAALGFPVAARGRYAQDQGPRGKVIDYRVPILIGQALINPGDIIFGDIDGILVIPKQHEQEVVTRALDKVTGEDRVRNALNNGMSTVEAFEKYGIM